MFFSRPTGHKYIDRGDPSSEDFSQADLVQDNNWHTLDLSTVIGKGVKLLLMYLYYKNNVSLSWVDFRQPGNSNVWNSDGVFNQVIGIGRYETIQVLCDINGKIDYRSGSSDNVLDVCIRGWFA